MSQYDRHLTTEQLSASLDQELSSQEQAEVDTHLKTCEQCQLELAELRQTVALLQALPQPALPRTFALPLNTIISSESSKAAEKSSRRAYQSIRTTIRAMSTLAAMVGVVFLLSALQISLPRGSANNASLPASSAGSAASVAGTQAPELTAASATDTLPYGADRPSQQATQPPFPEPTAPNTSSTPAVAKNEGNATPGSNAITATPSPLPNDPARNTSINGGSISQPQPPAPPLINLASNQSRTILGLILLISGVAGFIFLALQRRRSET